MQGVANDWFASYLSNRRQFVSLFHRNCDCQTVACHITGISAGPTSLSLTNKILLMICLNAPNILKFHLFADDTNLFPNNTTKNYFKFRNQH